MNTKPRVTLKISPCECRCPLPTRLRHTRDAPRSGSRLITCARVGFTSTAGPLQPAAADQRVCTSAGSLVAAAAFQLRCAPGQIPPVVVPAATAFTPRCYSLTPCRSPTSLDCGTQYTPTSTHLLLVRTHRVSANTSRCHTSRTLPARRHATRRGFSPTHEKRRTI